MTERRSLGTILMELGRISQDEQERALAHQKEHGGFFGEALVALGFISPEELEFGLASQFDLPYVFPDPEAIDRDVAGLVSPEWALTHLALPISRAGKQLVVVVDSPLKDELMGELSRRTGLEVEMAIASPDRIRKLIREIFDDGSDRTAAELRTVLSVEEFLERALGEGASRIGISIRGRAALGWWRSGGTLTRAALAGGWARDLEDRIVSSAGVFSEAEPGRAPDTGARDASLLWAGREHPVRVRALGRGGHREILLAFTNAEEDARPEFPPPPDALVREVRLLRRSGPVRFAVRSLPPEIEPDLLPMLPTLFFGREVRAAHLRARAAVGPGAEGGEDHRDRLVLTLPDRSDEHAIRTLLRELRDFHFDALSVAVPDPAEFWAGKVLALSPALFVSLPDPASREPLAALGVAWELEVKRDDDGGLAWRLVPLNITD